MFGYYAQCNAAIDAMTRKRTELDGLITEFVCSITRRITGDRSARSSVPSASATIIPT
jgi:hypothetical protein